jgi:hypothetical protein
MPDPYSIKIFLPQGDPDGLRLIEKSNWTGQGLAFSRSAFDLARMRPEISRTGVYVLTGMSEESSLPTLYVGEGDPVKPRLESHYANKDFWTWGVFFVSKDGSLNKAHVKHLESRLIEYAKAAKQANLDNQNTPQTPSLSEADIADCESYLQDMLSILPLLNLTVFEVPKAKPRAKNLLHIESKGVKAQGYEASQGFIVRKDSQAVAEEVPSIHHYGTVLRADLIKQGVLCKVNDHFIFSQDYTFSSPSTAAMVVLGRTANGRIEWKDNKGQTLKSIQAEATVENDQS